ncbi:MAG: helix-turn-helix transcriptional regulator [Dysgonomonas sp.]|nr:helix-turn-helix transcriptional regulator [Dysgonomonas sp.]
MNIVSTLNDELLQQPFDKQSEEDSLLKECQQIAYNYSKIENSIAVLSDLKLNKSYIYNGGFAEQIGLPGKENIKEINSIWEEEIFNKIHPDDLIEKHLLELQFFHLLKTFPVESRSDYHIYSKMRMRDKSGEYVAIQHRMFYVANCASGNFWLSLCLYNYAYNNSLETFDKVIINSATGEIIRQDKQQCNNILSVREKEVLLLIEKGMMSKEIADRLSISKNTVDRHRQNILEKLRVKNSIEACRVAKLMDLV